MDYKRFQKLLKSRDKRKCPQCGKMLKYKEFRFYEYEPNKYKFLSPCRSCENFNQRTDPKRRKYRFIKYGITKKEYLFRLQQQKNKCLICGKKLNDDHRKSRACIDHDHKSKKIRGILCNNCNTILGFVNDDINILKKAIWYLKKIRRQNSQGTISAC